MWFLKYINKELFEEVGPEGGGFSQEEIALRLRSPEGTEFPEQIKSEENQAEGSENEFKPSAEWDIFKSDADFKLPEGLSKENEQDLIKTHIAKKYGFEAPKLHPLSQQIEAMAKENPNITLNDLVNTVNDKFVDVSKMSVDEKIAFDLYNKFGRYDETTNPSGLTQEEVAEEISKMSKIQKLETARAVDSNVETYNQKLLSDYQEQQKAEYAKNYDTIIANINTSVEDIKKSVIGLNSIYGIEMNAEKQNGYLEEFKHFITPDKETGIRPLDKFFQDDINLYKLFVLGVKNSGEDTIVSLLTQGRENAKEALFTKLGITPTFSSNQRGNEQGLTEEQKKFLLGRPEGYNQQ